MTMRQPTRPYILIATLTILFLMGSSTFSTLTEAATTFIGSTVEGVDQAKQTITFRTPEGQSWTLGIANPDLLTKDKVAKGDQVSIEVDPKSDKVIKILRLAEQTQPQQTRPEPLEPTP